MDQTCVAKARNESAIRARILANCFSELGNRHHGVLYLEAAACHFAACKLLSPIPVLTAQRTTAKQEIGQETPEQRILAAETDNLAKLFFVSGRVQGVGYRYFIQREAARLGISGYAENLDDGRVEVYAIASAGALASLLTALRKGPTFAKVSSVDEEPAQIDPRYAAQFTIKG